MMSNKSIKLTLALCKPGEFAVKQFYPDGSSKDYDRIFHWMFFPQQFGDADELCEFLAKAAGLSNGCVLRGAPVQGLDLSQPHRRLLHPDGADQPTLRPEARLWVALDVDGAAVPFGLGAATALAEAAAFIRDKLLPVEFWGKRCIVTSTASTGRKGLTIARLRLWFFLDRMIEDKVLSRWATGFRHVTDFPLDPAVFRPVQPIYTGRPAFHGAEDPVPVGLRAFVLEGDPLPVPLDIAAFEKPLVKVERKINRQMARTGRDWRGAARVLVGGPDSFFIPLTRILGRAAADDEVLDDEVCAFVADLLFDKGAGLDRMASYDDDWIKRTLQRFRAKDARKSR